MAGEEFVKQIALIIFMGLVGVAIFISGFIAMRRYRLIQDTPRSKVRSVAMGLVEIHGTATNDDYFTTPFSKSKCVYGMYEIQEYKKRTTRDSKGNRSTSKSWQRVYSKEDRKPFFAKDETGKIYVDTKGANFTVDAKKVFLQKAGIFGGLSNLIETIKNGGKFDVDKLNLVPYQEKTGIGFGLGNRVGDRKYIESFIEPDEQLFVMGTAANDSTAPNNILIKQGENEKTFLISNKSEKDFLKKIKMRMFLGFGIGGVFIVGAIVLMLFF